MKPLADPGLDRHARENIETQLRQTLLNPWHLVATEALPADHPLRVGAKVVMDAFEAVTRGAVDDAHLTLAEIPHRGPLAPWKLLVRAIAAFYRRDDQTCTHCLDAIDPSSPPARLGPAIRGLIDRTPGALVGRAASLSAVSTANRQGLRAALESLDTALGRQDERSIREAARQAIEVCSKSHAQLLARLRQHIWVRALLANSPVERWKASLGASPVKDAHFWRLMALAKEQRGDKTRAVRFWEEFRRHTLAERWFPDRGPEVGALYLRMAIILATQTPRESAQNRRVFAEDLSAHYGDQPDAIRAAGRPPAGEEDARRSPDADELFGRACEVAPDAAFYEAWLNWKLSQGGNPAGAGLALGGPSVAWFLLRRALSMPKAGAKRRQDCVGAALSHARQVRDADLVAEAVEVLHGIDDPTSRRRTGAFHDTERDLRCTAEDVQRIVAFELEERKYPRHASRDSDAIHRSTIFCEDCGEEHSIYDTDLFTDPFDGELDFEDLDDDEDDEDEDGEEEDAEEEDGDKAEDGVEPGDDCREDENETAASEDANRTKDRVEAAAKGTVKGSRTKGVLAKLQSDVEEFYRALQAGLRPPNLPGELEKVVQEIARKHGGQALQLPDIGVSKRRDPVLFSQFQMTMIEAYVRQLFAGGQTGNDPRRGKRRL